jgi:hypothetical protein
LEALAADLRRAAFGGKLAMRAGACDVSGLLVFGDRSRLLEPRAALGALRERLEGLCGVAGGISRHGALVECFVELSEVAQGIADAEFEARGCDALTDAQDKASACLVALAHAVAASWRSAFRAHGDLSAVAALLSELAEVPLPPRVRCKHGEGYAFYSLYPEAYAAAAEQLGVVPDLRVIGIRSIGFGLAAMVAAGAGAPPPVSVRPVGHPFRRELALAPDFSDAMLRPGKATFAVVDEGPGLSGSSFGTVADFLEEGGVAPDRIHFFPGHAADLGPEALPRHRSRWRKANRHVVDFETLFLAEDGGRSLDRWFIDLVGKPVGPLDDISGGGWRRFFYGGEADWPPVHAQQERRKFLLRAERGTWLLKFAGVGAAGAAKLSRAAALAEAGFTSEVAGFRHGFLAERWLGDARPLRLDSEERDSFIRHLGRYLGFRARHFAATEEQGAPLSELLRMAQVNAAEALGPHYAARLDSWSTRLPELARLRRPIATDNRLHAWEWLRTPAGRLVKTDAIDHHAAHDLVGCQDVSWDIAGVVVEFDLGEDERETLCTLVERAAGRPVARGLLAFSLPCYLAFQAGYYTLAAGVAPDTAELRRLKRTADRYVRLLKGALDAAVESANHRREQRK